MEQWISFLIALSAGVIIALLGYFLNIHTLKIERIKKELEQQNDATRSILAEIEANLHTANIAAQILGQKRVMLPFMDEAWKYHRGKIYDLPQNTQTALHQFYLSVMEANGVVNLNNLQLSYGAGFLDKPYQERVGDIAEKGGEALRLLKGSTKIG